METFSSREKENIEKLLRTILLIFYPEAREDKTFCISNYIVEGFLDIAIHFHSFIKDEYRSYLTKNSVKLITELLDYPVSEESILEILPNDRVLIENKENIIILATNNYGRNENEKEFLFFKENLNIGLTPIESKNNYYMLSYIREPNSILSNKFKIDENSIELSLYRAREKQKDTLNIFKENIYLYIEEYFRKNAFCFTNVINGQYFQLPVQINEVFVRALTKNPYNFPYIPNNENIIAYFKYYIGYICNTESSYNYVLEVKKFLSSYTNLFSLKELEFLDSYSTTLDIEIPEGIICQEIIQINEKKIKEHINKDINLEDKYYLYYINKETLSPKIFIL